MGKHYIIPANSKNQFVPLLVFLAAIRKNAALRLHRPRKFVILVKHNI